MRRNGADLKKKKVLFTPKALNIDTLQIMVDNLNYGVPLVIFSKYRIVILRNVVLRIVIILLYIT